MEPRRALVTGATSGIGAATAVTLAEQGYALWLTYAHDRGRAEDTARACAAAGADAHVSQLDLRSADSITALAAEITDSWGHLQVLVNNGGSCPYRALDDIEIDEWDAVMETNARGTFLLSRAALPLLRAAGPDDDRGIVNVSSVAGQVGGILTAVHYATSKAAILAITRSFARLLAGEGIRVNAVTPGPVTSGITDQLSDEGRASLTASVPLGRFGTAAEVAWIIASLASPRASFVTGATYDVNGGVRVG